MPRSIGHVTYRTTQLPPNSGFSALASTTICFSSSSDGFTNESDCPADIKLSRRHAVAFSGSHIKIECISATDFVDVTDLVCLESVGK